MIVDIFAWKRWKLAFLYWPSLWSQKTWILTRLSGTGESHLSRLNMRGYRHYVLMVRLSNNCDLGNKISTMTFLGSFFKNFLSPARLNRPSKGGPSPGHLMGWLTKLPFSFELLPHTLTLCCCLTLAQATSESWILHVCGMIFLFFPCPHLFSVSLSMLKVRLHALVAVAILEWDLPWCPTLSAHKDFLSVHFTPHSYYLYLPGPL